jgi:CRISPR-associated protein Csx14
MHNLRVSMDPTNPGQFFACCGLWEMAERGGATVLTHFRIEARRPRYAEFVMESESELRIGEWIGALRQAKASPIAPAEKSVAPVRIEWNGSAIELDWWLDRFRAEASGLKCWAGQQTSVGITSELLKLLPENADERLLNFRAMTTTRFGVDPRSAWNAADLGYSPNEHQQDSATFPAVEMLAAIGLGGFRPATRGRGREREQVYALWAVPLPKAAARLACCAPWDGLAAQRYRFRLGKRGNYRVFRFSELERSNGDA